MNRTATVKGGAKIILVVGRSGTGKTTLSQRIAEHGFEYISASACLQAALKQESAAELTRIGLADYGRHLRQCGQLDGFHGALRKAVSGTKRCVVDGIRFPETRNALYGVNVDQRMIYLFCDTEVRRKRLLITMRASEFRELQTHETERSVDEWADAADIKIETSSCVGSVTEQAIEALRTWRWV